MRCANDSSTGYGFEFGDRGDYLETIHSNLKDKSKVHASKCIVSVEEFENGVSVKCEDGSSYDGDVLVGADGVRSKVREEMWRLASPTLPALVERDRNGTLLSGIPCVAKTDKLQLYLPSIGASLALRTRHPVRHQAIVTLATTGIEVH